MFESIEELNEAVRQHRQAHSLTKTELAVLDIISQYSCVDIGRSYLRKSKIGDAIGKSRRTIIRACNRLEALGIIRQLARMRTTGDRRQASNLIEIIKPVTPECHTEETPIKNSKDIVINNTYPSEPLTPYVRFKTLVSSYVNDSQLTNRLYGIWKAHTSYLRNAFDMNALLQAGLQAIKATFQASKRKSLRSLTGYYNGTLDRMLDHLFYDEIARL